MKILVTGAAGFIGFHVVQRLLKSGHAVIGIDNLNDYYDVRLKEARLAILKGLQNFEFSKINLADREAIADIFRNNAFDVVIHLGAQAGVRYSIDNPFAYLESNLAGTLNILEGCRSRGVEHLIYASSSSVYGSNSKIPFSVEDRVDNPVSLYAATKKSNELMCHTYAHLYGFSITGLRFFTVYGPWGRPDMAYFKFAKAISAGEPIDVYNYGDMKRDFTYIDDIVDGIEAITQQGPIPVHGSAPHRVYNLGHNHPEQLLTLIEILERWLGKTTEKRMLPMQPGDVYATYADIEATRRDYGFHPRVPLEEGLRRFSIWYRHFYL